MVKPTNMKAGLFLCDHVKDNYQSRFGDYQDMFAGLFPNFEWKLYDVINSEFPESLSECDLYLATGSHHSVYENLNWINRLKELIREIYLQKKYFIGFCFGHQLLGEALGGKVEKSSNGWCVGVHDFDIVSKQSWMVPFQEQISMLMMCQDQVVQLPPDSKILAKSEKCPIAMFQVGKTMLGIQAHPEFSREYDQLLMENRIERIGESIVKKSIESLEKEIHPQIIREWVNKFTFVG